MSRNSKKQSLYTFVFILFLTLYKKNVSTNDQNWPSYCIPHNEIIFTQTNIIFLWDNRLAILVLTVFILFNVFAENLKFLCQTLNSVELEQE